MERRPQWGPVVDNLPPARDMRENILEPAIVEITAPDVAIADKPTNIEDFQSISSYTWAKGRDPTIIVPGLPREWLDRSMPFKVPFDSGIRMFHEDAFYMSDQSTLIPLFRAVDAMAPATEPKSTASENADAIDWATVDFVTDRNNLRKLLRWIREPGPMETIQETSETSPTNPTSDGSEGKQVSDATAAAAPAWDTRKDFRIDLQLGGANTMLMNRWAARAREVIVPPKGGCRANFELEHTAAARGCENGAGHYRIVQYSISGLKMVVRFEVDACVPATTTAAAGSNEEAERGGSPSSPSPERNARGAEVATPDPISGIPVMKSAKALAQQSFNDEDEGALWGGGSTAEDWGVAEEPPASQPNPHDKPEAKKPETEEVDLDKEAALWAGGGDDSWGMLPVPHRSSKGEHASSKGKEDTRDRAPPPEDSGWDLPDDASAWGVTADTAQNEDSSVTNGELTVVRSGALLPQSSILELATRSIKFADRTSNEDIFLQLFLTQTPTHLVAIHQYGNFEKIVRQELQSPEFVSIAEMEGTQKSLAQFVELLKEIQRLVKELGTGRRLSLVCEKGKLELFGLAGEEGRLSDDELERFKTSV
ncbi:hypothetical protein LXA43DRAFT_956977 [Ganoderma leucocontextum]|nr:hypothetical protein LXA43DRAFT_956977 [Ganoderma leucocontextum]